jgi:uncharacterized membrane protein YdjX (TVP38/TMEM64 family)/Fe-S oxidoreductase
LAKFGHPKELLATPSEVLFFCTNCTACSKICPERLPVAQSLYEAKTQLLRKDYSTREPYISAKSYAERGHRFPFSHWERADTVFWPGCSLAGSAPNLVLKIKNSLSDLLNQRVGIVLDCCFDPCFQLGGVEDVAKAFKDIKERLISYKVKKVILGCTNCYKNFKRFLPSEEVEVKHILELIPQSLLKIPFKEAYLHHPCPAWQFEEIRKKARTLIEDKVELKEARLPACCGAGGALYQNEELASEFREKTLKWANHRPIITYCMGCKGRFLKSEANAYHILEFLPNYSPRLKPLSSTQKWINRFFLSLRLKLFSKKALVLTLYLIALITFYTFSYVKGFDFKAYLNYLNQIKGNPLVIFLYLLIYTVAPSLFVSSLALTMVAGLLWGPFLGTLIAVTGATLGASLSFLLARYLFYQAVAQRFGKVYLKTFWERVEKDGWKFVAFLRLFPLFPYPVINFLLGLTPIKFSTYVITSFIFMLPGGFLYTFLGYSILELLKQNPWYLILAILLLIGFSLVIKKAEKLFRRPLL